MQQLKVGDVIGPSVAENGLSLSRMFADARKRALEFIPTKPEDRKLVPFEMQSPVTNNGIREHLKTQGALNLSVLSSVNGRFREVNALFDKGMPQIDRA